MTGVQTCALPILVEQIKNFSDQDMKNVINYITWVPVPAEQLAPSKDWQNPDFK